MNRLKEEETPAGYDTPKLGPHPTSAENGFKVHYDALLADPEGAVKVHYDALLADPEGAVKALDDQKAGSLLDIVSKYYNPKQILFFLPQKFINNPLRY